MTRLYIPNYEGECYYYKTINCVDASIAVASGYFNYDNYFFYCAYYSLYSIWGLEEDNRLFNRCKLILGKLGLKDTYLETRTKELFFNKIKKSLEEKQPIIIFFDYYYMFYCDQNYLLNHGEHTVIICGINDDKSTITIMDCSHINFDTPFKCLTLTQDILWDIWEKSNAYFSEEKYPISYKIMQIEDMQNHRFIDTISFLNDIINHNCISEEDIIIENIVLEDKYDTSWSHHNKRDYIDSAKTIFDLIDKFFAKTSSELFLEYKLVKQNYLESKNNIFLNSLKKYSKGETLQKETKEKYINDIKYANKKLANIIKDIYNMATYDSTININSLKNYIKDSIVEASSELFEDNNLYKADRVKDDNYLNFIYNMWSSDDIPCQHWIQVDLCKVIHVYKVVIIHDYRSPDLFLIDFTIQGSKNKIDWLDIDVIRNNNKNYTVHFVQDNELRYIKILINKPSKIDNMARIFGIECWGY